ncbi:MAG: P-II family nitrogen regulator [Endomicrobium sp.]|jgi:nitrogen regulatory protein PII|nr:P-II family nitrogen regulator [Endomicrobium sp.]
MKEIIAIIRPVRSYATKNALADKGFFALSNFTVVGKGKGVSAAAQINDINGEDKDILAPQMHAKTLIDIFVRDSDVDSVIEIIVKTNKADSHGDGKIFVLPCCNAQRIRTGEENDEAIL